MKKILARVLAFCLVAGAMLSNIVKFVDNSITAMANNTEGSDLKQIYRDKLYELIETGWVFSDNDMFNGSRFDFYDIDANGIPELVVTYNNSSNSGGFIYSIVNGKLTESEINVKYGSVAVNSEKHLVYYNGGNAYVPYNNYYRFSEGELQDITNSGENFENITWDSTGDKYSFDELSIDEALDSITIDTSNTDTDITTPTTAYSESEFLTCEKYSDHVVISSCDESVESVNIPAEIEGVPVTEIYANTFKDCSNLTEITIPDSITEIGDSAFEECSSLTEITIPDGVISIGQYAFKGTPWLENKQKENPLVIVNNILIDGTTCEGNISIPDEVTSISDCAFENSSLTEITIPDTVTSIGYSAFHCSSLTEITFLNPDCNIEKYPETINSDVIKGYEGSTAQEYAEEYGIEFINLEDISTKNKLKDADIEEDNNIDENLSSDSESDFSSPLIWILAGVVVVVVVFVAGIGGLVYYIVRKKR